MWEIKIHVYAKRPTDLYQVTKENPIFRLLFIPSL